MSERSRLAGLPRIFNLEDVAKALLTHPQTVRRWIREGRLRAHRLGARGSRWRITAGEVARFLAATRTTATAPPSSPQGAVAA